MIKYSYIILLYLLLAFVSSCKSSKHATKDGFENELFSINGVTGCKEGHSGDAVDSQIGEVRCDGIIFAYDYGRYGDRGPVTAEERFKEQFDNYHYSKFFELAHIDPKVFKIFRDSVQVIQLHRNPLEEGELMFECSTCNAVAELLFKDWTWYYPTTVNENTWAIDGQLFARFLETDQKIKVFKGNADRISATAVPLPYSRRNDYLSIAIRSSVFAENKQVDILKTIRLISNRDSVNTK